MQYLKADTSTEVVIGPVVSVINGYVPVTNLVGSSADEFEIIKHGATTTTTIAGTLAAITGADGYYALDLSATDTSTEGRLTVLIKDDSLCLPVRADFMVVNANVYDSMFAAAGTDYLKTDCTQVAGTAQTAGDLAALVTTVDGVVDSILTDTGTTLPATLATIDTVVDGIQTDVSNGTDGLGALKTLLDDVPTTSEFNARTLVASAYFDPAADTVANVTTVATCTTNTDMVGTDGAYTGTPPTVAAIADAIWDEDLSTGHVVANSAAVVVNDVSTDTSSTIPNALTAINGYIDTEVAAIKTVVDGIQTDLDNGTDGLGALKTLIDDVPTTSEFNARTLAAGSYFDPATDTVANVTTVATCTTNTDMRGTDSAASASALATVDANVDAILVDTGTTLPASLADIPTVAEFNARTLVASGYFDPATDAVASVTLVDTCTNNTDMRGTDSAATASALATVDSNVDAILVDTGTTLPASLAAIDNYIDTEVGAIKAKTDQLTFTTSNQLDTQVISMATNSLTADAAAADFIGASEIAASASQEIADKIAADWVAGDASPQAIASAILDATLTSHVTADSLAVHVKDILVDTGTTIPAAIATVDSNVDAILLDTGTTLPGTLATIGANTSDILTDTGTTLPAALTAIDDYVDTEVSAIKAKTDQLTFTTANQVDANAVTIGGDGSGLTDIPWNAAWDAEVQSEVTDALEAYDAPTKTELDSAVAPLATSSALATVDSTVDAILFDTGTTLPATLAGLNDLSAVDVADELATYDAPTKAELDSAVAPLATASALATVDSNVDAVLADTETTIPATLATIGSNTSDILTDTGTTLPASIAGLNDLSAADVASELATYNGPTKAELDLAVAPLATRSALATTDAVVDAMAAKLPADTATQIGLIEPMRGTDAAYTGTPPTAGAIAAEVLETPANKLATGSGGVVTTDSASRTASQATGFATPTNITEGNITTVSDLTVTAHPEPSGVPAVDETLANKIGYVFAALRNKVTVTATKKQFYNDGDTAEWEKDLSDDGTTYTETEGNAP